MSEPAFVAETLAWCNEMRADQQMESLDVLPKGKIADPESCPCGKATGLMVQFYDAYLPLGDGSAKHVCSLPNGVREFVVAFDNSELPQYIEPSLPDEGFYFDVEGNSAPLDEVQS